MSYLSWVDAFFKSVRKRLHAGATEYSDRSFDLPPEALMQEVQEELADVAGWAFILWARCERMRRALANGDTHDNATE